MSGTRQPPRAAHLALRHWWERMGEERKPAHSPEQVIERLKGRYRLTLPADFEGYLLETAPGRDLWDEGDINWWALSAIKSLPDGYEHPVNNPQIADDAGAYLLFADYLIWCWGWAICCSSGQNHGKVALIGGKPDHFVANTFSEFVSRYLEDPGSVANQA